MRKKTRRRTTKLPQNKSPNPKTQLHKKTHKHCREYNKNKYNNIVNMRVSVSVFFQRLVCDREIFLEFIFHLI